jgi:adenine-specific DNA-methyltransferase
MKNSRIELSTHPSTELILGDSLKVLSSMADESVDLILTSPPYNIGKDYEKVLPLEDYLEIQRSVIEQCVRILKPSGSICWQVGFTKVQGELTPLEYLLYPIFKDYGLELRNRIVWTFGHGMHAQKRFSGRHESVMWFSKNSIDTYFDLDEVRVPQKYPGKRHYKGPSKGEYSGNPLGKNPGDVWDIPNVKAHHVEKTEHQCQFPVALAQRIIRALAPQNGIVLDPFSGVATTSCAAVFEGRSSVGIEKERKYFDVARKRVKSALKGTLEFRPIEKPIQEPSPNSRLAKRDKE